MKKRILLILLASLSVSQFLAQTPAEELTKRIQLKEAQSQYERYNPIPNQIFAAEQDCNSAIPVCQNIYTQNTSYSGSGGNDEIPSNSSCLGSNEKNSVWYIFTVTASGNLAFQITPNVNSEDYDFALYNLTGTTCSAISAGSLTPIRCNFSATGGNTGLSASGSNASEPASGPNQSTVLPVTVGQTYVLVLSNYSSSQNGYTLNFSTSTASIFDTTPPTVASATAVCGTNTVTAVLSENVLCSSISANGSEFTITGTGGPYTVTAATGINCGTSTNSVQLTLNTALSGGGPWTVSVGMGTDGNSLIDNCGNSLVPTQSQTFNLSPATATITGSTSICKGQTMALTASNGTAYTWTGSGITATPQASNQTISLVQNTAGLFTYNVTVQNGTCGSANASITVTVKTGPESHFTVAPTTICAGQTVTFTNTSVIPCTTGGSGLAACNCGAFLCNPTPLTNANLFHTWSFGDPLSGTSNFSTSVNPTHVYNTPGTYTANLNVNFLLGGGCSTNESHTITVLPGAGPLVASADGSVCPGAPFTLTVSGGSSYSWTSVPAGFTSTAATVTVNPTVNTTYNVTSPGCGGTISEQVIVTMATGVATSAITGPTSLCPNSLNQTFSVTNHAGSTYAWTVPAGATIVSGQGTNSIVVNFGATVTPVSVIETTTCNTNPAVSTTIATAVVAPVTSAITGVSPICINATNQTFSVTNTAGSTYAWTVPAGATIVSGQGTNSITVNFGSTPGNVSVIETSPCGTGAQVDFAVTFSSLPVTSAITGPTSLCPNSAGIIFSVTNNAGSTYAWTVPSGATIVSGQGTNSITVDFGATLTPISVTETSACGASAPVSTTINTSVIPPVTSAITGPSPVCPTATAQVYSVTNTAGSTYAWTVPAGATIVSGQGTNSITVDFGATAGTISVTETSNCGVGTPVTQNVLTNTIPTTPAITGPSSVCPNATSQTYSVANNSGSTYTWTVPVGATIVSGQGTNTITVDFGATAGTISVIQNSTCGASPSVSTNVTTSTTPVTSAITGPSPVCPNATAQVYSVTNNVGSTYTWAVPAGATIVSGQGTNSITVDFGATAGTISVTETSPCATGTPVNITITNSPLPTTSAITGLPTACANATGQTFSVTNTAGSTYAWTVPAGATITAGQGTNSITVDLGTTSGNVSVVETNGCGNGTAVTFAVSINPILSNPVISGSTALCAPATNQTYSVPVIAGVTNTWTITGATIVSGQGTNSIVIDLTGSSNATVSLNQTDACNNVNAGINVTVTTVVVNATPVTPNICSGANTSITATGATSYAWTPSTGLNSTTTATVVANPTTTTTYTITGTVGTCTATTTTTINVTPTPSLVAPPAVSICQGASTTLTTSGATNYTWAPSAGLSSTSGASVTANPTATTVYTIVGINGTCTDVRTVTVTVVPNPIANAGPDKVVCIGESIGLEGAGGGTYSWSPSSGLSSTTSATPNASPSVTTQYILTVSAGGLCTDKDTVRVTVNPLPNVFAGNDTTINIDQVMNLNGSGNGTLTWTYDPSLSCLNCANPLLTPIETQTYILTAEDANGCVNTDTVTITITKDYALYVPNSFTPNGNGVAENEIFKAEGYGITKLKMYIFDRWGNKIATIEGLENGWDGTNKGKKVMADVYVYKIEYTVIAGPDYQKTGQIRLIR